MSLRYARNFTMMAILASASVATANDGIYVSPDYGTSFAPHGAGASIGIEYFYVLLEVGTGASKRGKLGIPLSTDITLDLSPFYITTGRTYYKGSGRRPVRYKNDDDNRDGKRAEAEWEFHYQHTGVGFFVYPKGGTLPSRLFFELGAAHNTYSKVKVENDEDNTSGEPDGIYVDEWWSAAGEGDVGLYVRGGLQVQLIPFGIQQTLYNRMDNTAEVDAATDQPASSTRSSEEVRANKDFGIQVGTVSTLQGLYSLSKQSRIGLLANGFNNTVHQSNENIGGSGPLHLSSLTKKQTLLGVVGHYFLGNSFMLSSSLTHGVATVNYTLASISQPDEEGSFRLRKTVLQVGVGNEWSWNNGFVLGIDWVALGFQNSQVISRKDVPSTTSDSQKISDDIVERTTKRSADTYVLGARLGYHF